MDRVEKATLVLFGGTGDLAARKLIPALFSLWKHRQIVDCLIVAVGRRVESTEQFREMLTQRVSVAKKDLPTWNEFARCIEFHRGDIQTRADFESLRDHLNEMENARQLPGHRLFYYAVTPSLFGPITQQLSEVGLLRRGLEPAQPWQRIIVEKPFGHDAESAATLDESLHVYASERQIYRIDHYLGKETVQNLLAFRFANGLFEPLWNNNYIEHVQISVAEAVGVEGRAEYYEKAGALRDMMQNHMMQLLAVTAMEPPIGLDADAIRDEKVKILRSIRLPANPAEVDILTVRGQYGPGEVDGQGVIGYRDEPDVAAESTTPTYVAARLFLDTWRWAGVPFLMRHGKRLAKRGTEVAIKFRTPALALFRGTQVFGNCTNLLVIRIQPNEGISLHFGAKRPGAGMRISTVQMDFEYQKSFDKEIPEAYERLLLDALLGDPTLFTRSDEVAATWRWADVVIDAWNVLPPPTFPNYSAGSWGPSAAEALFPAGDQVSAGSCPLGWRRW
ncbi:glucose-6-phosphate dehydrogenase [bacterium]|jgi:glucose-6-phosphate 1-dehydrogenase|nr:glucose-6-phosphate dehydrogenase [bacterium]